MVRTFGQIAVEQAGCFEDPDNPLKTHSFERVNDLARCIDAVLSTADDSELLRDLPNRLNSAAQTLSGDFSLDSARRSVEDLARGFENFLQLVATIKFEHRKELLEGDETHKGLLKTELGGLLLGTPTARHQGISQVDVPKIKIVTFSFDGAGLRDRTYECTRLIRNQIHGAEKQDALKLLRSARIIFAAYLFATEENLRAISRKLYVYSDYLQKVRLSRQIALPYFVEPVLREHRATPRKDEPEVAKFGGISLGELENLIGSGEPCSFGVFGNPGAGKTTLVQELTRRLALTKGKDPLGASPLPVLIEAGRYGAGSGFDILISRQLGIGHEELPGTASAEKLFLIIDGVNEIQARDLRRAIIELQNLQENLPTASFLFTSRFDHLFRGLRGHRFELAPFDDEQILDFIMKSFGDGERATAFFEELRGLPRLLELSRTPLILFMLAEISSDTLKVPKNRGRLLQEFMTRFLERETVALSPIHPVTVERLLSHLAFEMRSRKEVSISRLEVERELGPILQSTQKDIGTVDVISAIEGAHLLVDLGANRLAFFHELVQEYFAALEIERRYKEGRIDVKDYLGDQWWEEVLLLLMGLSEEDQVLFRTIREHAVSLSARAVMDSPVPDPARQSEVVSRASELLEASQADPVEAYQALATIWNQEAIEKAVHALGSRRQVQDFVSRFATDPFGASADLLATDPSPAILAGVSQTLRVSGKASSVVGSLRLGEVVLDLIEKKLAGSLGGIQYGQLLNILSFVDIRDEERTRAVQIAEGLCDRGHFEEANGLLGHLTLFDRAPQLRVRVLTGLVLSQGKVGVTGHLKAAFASQNDRRGLWFLALLNHSFHLARTLTEPGVDWDWCPRPLAESSALTVLYQDRPTEEAIGILKDLFGPAHTDEVLESQLVRLLLPPRHVAGICRALGKPDLLSSVRARYLNGCMRKPLDPAAILELCQGSDPGEVPHSVAQPLIASCIYFREVPAALSLVHASGLHDVQLQVIHDAEQMLAAGTVQPDTGALHELVFNSFWTRWSKETRAALISGAVEIGVPDDALVHWGDEARSELKEELRTRLSAPEDAIPPGPWQSLGLGEEVEVEVKQRILSLLEKRRPHEAIRLASTWNIGTDMLGLHRAEPLEWEAAAIEEAERLFGEGSIQTAFRLLDSWKINPSDPRVSFTRLEEGLPPCEGVVLGFDAGIFELPEVEAWFLARVRNNDCGEALKILSSRKRQQLRDVATIAVLELLERDEHAAAARLIAGFGLEDSFEHELLSLIEPLLEIGKAGMVCRLSERLRPDQAAMVASSVLEKIEQHLREGRAKDALSLMVDAGVSFARSKFSEIVESSLTRARKEGAQEALASFANTPGIWAYVDDRNLLLTIIAEHDLPLEAKFQRWIPDRHFGFVELPAGLGEAFLHKNALKASPETLVAGDPIEVRIRLEKKGPNAVWARPPTADGNAKVAEHSEPGPADPDALDEADRLPAQIEDLKNRWGARIRRGR